MMQRFRDRTIALALVVALAGCADPANRAVGTATLSADLQSTGPGSSPEERAALSRIARLVAVATSDERTRKHLRRDMRAAPYREHKLALTPYLRSKDGSELLAGMIAAGGGTEPDVFNTLSSIRPLELYMPVAKHRESWMGGDGLLVVSQLEEGEPIFAFDSRGRSVALDVSTAPLQPTLSIVPVETRFDQPLAGSLSRNVRDQNGAAIGTLEPVNVKQGMLIACDETSCGGGISGSPTPPPTHGMYLEFSRIVDAKEPWFRGNPEIEVHIQGPIDQSDPKYGADLSCSGAHSVDFRKVFDQNGAFWTGKVLLYSQDEVSAFNARFSEGFNVMFWEDDDTSCKIKTDSDALVAFLEASARTTGAVIAVKVVSAPWYITVGTFIATMFSDASWLLTSDDFLGAAVDQVAAAQDFPDATHIIMLGGAMNGRARIIWH